ncbi:MAG TPA: hypothetical protein VJ372_08405 [Pyrinomonadaceae bacterium]|jgi:hypothetical protein|nr:hypothetical protein [Pyrinomonadaceae bacterium]
MTEMNSKSPLFELVFGIATGLVTVFNPLTLGDMEVMSNRPADKETLAGLFGLLLMFIAPGLLVGLGSYIHTTKEKTVGFVLTMIGGSILVLEFPLLFLGAFGLWGGFFYSKGLAAALYTLTPSPLAALTMVAAFLVRRSLRKHSIDH